MSIDTDGPWAAPTGQPVGAAAEASRPTSFEFTRESLLSTAQWWFRPVIEARTWTTLGSLFVGAIWGPLMFTFAIIVVAVTSSLMLAAVGFLLVVPGFAVLNSVATVERHRAGWVGEPIPAPRFATADGGAWSAITIRLQDGARWRQVLFFGLFVVVGPVLFALGLLPWSALFQLVFTDFDPRSFNLGGLIVAALLAGAAPRITVAVAKLGRSFTASLLGPDETVELQERVSELSGQRQQILDAVADERRRIERNLHDGVQQNLVALGIDIGRARSRLDSDPDTARQLLDEARDKVRGSIGELRMIGRGLHPAVLEDRGLDAALSSVVARSPIPITVDIATDAALPDDVAATAYYVASEAVANMLKHSRARIGSIRLEDDPSTRRAVRLSVHDDGRGGVDASRGSGLAGMRARVESLDGVFDVNSPIGGPTTLVAVLPLDASTRLNESTTRSQR